MNAVDVLRDKRDFERVYEQGKRARRNGIVVIAAGRDDDCCRVGLSVPRRVGTAVVRNKIRRRIREAIRQRGWGWGYDIVVQAGVSTTEISYQELEKHLGEALAAAAG